VPVHIVNVVIFSGIYYGMGGLRAGGAAFGKFTCVMCLMQLIATQVCDYACVFVLGSSWVQHMKHRA
jgi:hypothetical protein